MKTSKIIFITLLATIALYILAAMIEVRINGGRKGTYKGPEVSLQKQKIPSFKVLYVSNSINLIIIQGDTSYIEVASLKDNSPYKVNFTIKDDTLNISDVKVQIQGNSYLSVKICTTDSLISIITKNSRFTIQHLASGKMSLETDNSSVGFSWYEKEKSSFLTLNILARNHSKVTSDEFKVDSLGIVLQNSEANLSISAKVLSGTLSESSKLGARQPEEISLKIDATSKINISGY